MIICGVKVSHDGAVAVLDGHRLLFSVEVEKLSNGYRYATLGDLRRIEEVLADHGLSPDDVDHYVVDGWYPPQDRTAVHLPTRYRGQEIAVPVAPYVADGPGRQRPRRFRFTGLAGGGALRHGYSSYAHATQHLIAGYATSPFAAAGEEALALVWDGGTLPRLYRVRPEPVDVEYLGPLFPLVGDAFTSFSMQLPPFRRDLDGVDEATAGRHHLEIAGKAMAYAGLGSVEEDALEAMDKLVMEDGGLDPAVGARLADRSLELFPGLSSADLIATFQEYVGRLLVRSLTDAVDRLGADAPARLCLAGGCALNIKWNSAVRAAGLFEQIWVPPFPNDAGAAVGTACCELVHRTQRVALEWNVYSGPQVVASSPAPGWSSRPCDERGLALLLHERGEPVVVVDGRAELGPRALGNRSILAPAVSATMKDELNRLKERADYRPVAPVCLESAAAQVFEPGGNDPYMLFDHRVRPGWVDRVPAVLHLDGTARLQTVTPQSEHTAIGRVLSHYERASGIPLLCNTSANHRGRGFFPDARSAMDWGRTRYVWSSGVLYTNEAFPPAGGTLGTAR